MGKAKTMNNSMNIYKEIFIWVLTRAAESDIISYYGIMGACAALACTAYFALGFSQPGKEVDFMTRSDARKAVLDLLFERELLHRHSLRCHILFLLICLGLALSWTEVSQTRGRS